jgi:hypothetical protein
LDSLEEAGFEGRMGGRASMFDFAFPEEELGEVTGPPNRNHWKVGNRIIEFLDASSSDDAIGSAICRLTAGVGHAGAPLFSRRLEGFFLFKTHAD